MYEPVHGSAPDIAGKGLANPLAELLSLSMLFRYSFNMEDEADLVDEAVSRALDAGPRTPDIIEGVDERFLIHNDVTEVSVGDFILSGGEIGAQLIIDATVRLLPNVIGNSLGLVEESFENNLLISSIPRGSAK